MCKGFNFKSYTACRGPNWVSESRWIRGKWCLHKGHMSSHYNTGKLVISSLFPLRSRAGAAGSAGNHGWEALRKHSCSEWERQDRFIQCCLAGASLWLWTFWDIHLCFSLGFLSFVSRIQYVLFLQRKISLGNCIALFLKLIYFFVYFWLPWVFAAARGFSLVVVHGLLITVASLVWNTSFRARAQ